MTLLRHGREQPFEKRRSFERLCPGNPRLAVLTFRDDVDARHKVGYDGACGALEAVP
jgi:hypothetical protein